MIAVSAEHRADEALLSYKLISGKRHVLEHTAQLAALATSHGQGGVIEQLPFQIEVGAVRCKRTHIVLIFEEKQDLVAAAQFYEYLIAGVPSGVFTSIDFNGERAVLAPEQSRLTFGRRAAEWLLRRRALLVLLSVAGEDPASDVLLSPLGESKNRCRCAFRRKTFRHTLSILNTRDETIAQMGDDTRRNFRRQRRKVDEAFHPSFLVGPEISEEEVLKLNQVSGFPVSKKIARWRRRQYSRLPGATIFGLRAKDGRWLSLLGARCIDDLLDIDWQWNDGALRKFSLVTAMRMYLLEHALQHGIHFMRFDGGTAHSMQTTFKAEQAIDLLIARRFLSQRFLTTVLPRYMPRDSLLGNALTSPDMIWSS